MTTEEKKPLRVLVPIDTPKDNVEEEPPAPPEPPIQVDQHRVGNTDSESRPFRSLLKLLGEIPESDASAAEVEQAPAPVITPVPVPVSENPFEPVPPREKAPSAVHLMRSGIHQTYDIAGNIPRGRGFQIVQWSRGKPSVTPVNGSIAQHVSHLGWYLHGANIVMGSTSSGADKTPLVDATGTVHGAIPRAIRAIRSHAAEAIRLNPSNLDDAGRPYQFASILVLGREDHERLMRTLNDPTPDFEEIIGAAGAPTGTIVSGVLHDERGSLFALTVEFPDPAFIHKGQSPKHFIFLHSTRAIGGGKSDEALREGNLRIESRALAKEFQWWMSALELGNGVIGSIESTLGGTARTARYGLLSAKIPNQLFAREAFEAIGIDDAAWVKEHLPSETHSYRANFATTLIRTVYGDVSRRLAGIRVEFADRHDILSRNARDVRAQTAILRNIQMSHPELELLKGDLSDEHWTLAREEGITDSKYHAIHDPVERNKKWNQQRRTHTGTATTFSETRIRDLAEGRGSGIAKDTADQVIERMRGLATSTPGVLPAGGFMTVTAYLHPTLEPSISKSMLNDAMETIGDALLSAGAAKAIINLQRAPFGLHVDPSLVMVHITEDQPGTNLLIVSTDDVNTHEKRQIIANPYRDPDDPKIDWHSTVSGFGRLLSRMTEAHFESGYGACERDAEIILAYFRYWFTNGHRRSNQYIGGSNRPMKRKDTSREGGI